MQYEKTDALGSLDEDDSDADDEDDEDFEYVEEGEETEEGEEYEGEYAASDDENYHSNITESGNDTFQSSRNVSLFTEPVGSPAFNNFSLKYLNDSVAFTGEENRPNTVETFCNTTVPSLAMFNALEENDKVLAFKTFLHVSSNALFAWFYCSEAETFFFFYF